MKRFLISLQRLSSLSFTGFVRFVRMKFLGKEVLLAGKCIGCGSCCRKINIETDSGWIRRESVFKRIAAKHPEYERFLIIGRDVQGHLQFTCEYITLENSCSDYDNRPSICRGFPDKSLYLCGGTLPRGCGYSLTPGTPFASVLEKEMSHRKQQ